MTPGQRRYGEHDQEHYERPRRHTRPRTKDRPSYDEAHDGLVLTVDRGRYGVVVEDVVDRGVVEQAGDDHAARGQGLADVARPRRTASDQGRGPGGGAVPHRHGVARVEQGRGQGVAGMALVGLAIEGEAERAAPVHAAQAHA